MLKKVIGLVCMQVLSSQIAFGAEHILAPGIGFSYKFQPHNPEEFTNPLPMKVTAQCHVTIADNQAVLFQATLLSNKVTKVNGNELAKGKHETFTFHSGDVLEVESGAGSSVRVENLSDVVLEAECHTKN